MAKYPQEGKQREFLRLVRDFPEEMLVCILRFEEQKLFYLSLGLVGSQVESAVGWWISRAEWRRQVESGQTAEWMSPSLNRLKRPTDKADELTWRPS